MTNFYDQNGGQIKAGDTLLFEGDNEIFEIAIIERGGVLGWGTSYGDFHSLDKIHTFNHDTRRIGKTTIRK